MLLRNATYTATCFGRTTMFKQKYIISQDYSTDSSKINLR
jgi:hypothetical protein